MVPQRRHSVLPTVSLELAERHAILGDLYLRSAGCVPPGYATETERRRGMSEYILQYAAEGEGWARAGEQRWALKAGSGVIIPPRTPHAYGGAEKGAWLNYWIHFRGRRAEAFFRELGLSRGHWLLDLPPDRQVVDLFESILESYIDGHTLSHLLKAAALLNSLLTRFCLLASRQGSAQSDRSPGVSASIQYMHDRIASRLTLEDLAKAASLSRARYHELFRLQTGQTPMSYFNQLKIRKACDELLFSDQTVEGIALKLGFANGFYFSRVFKQIIGVSPSRYREQPSV